MSVEVLRLKQELTIDGQKRINDLEAYKIDLTEGKFMQIKICNGKTQKTGEIKYAKIKLDRGQAHLLMLWLQEKLG